MGGSQLQFGGVLRRENLLLPPGFDLRTMLYIVGDVSDLIYLLTAIGLSPEAEVQYTFTHKQYVDVLGPDIELNRK